LAAQEILDSNNDCDHLLPECASRSGYDNQDTHSKASLDANDWRSFDITDPDIKTLASGLFATSANLDDKIGEILQTAKRTRGRRRLSSFASTTRYVWARAGLWFKM